MARFLFLAVIAIVANLAYGEFPRGFANANGQRYYVVMDILTGEPGRGERLGREIGMVEERAEASISSLFPLTDTYTPLNAEYLSVSLASLEPSQETSLYIDRKTGNINAMRGNSLIGYYINFLRGRGHPNVYTVANLPTLGPENQMDFQHNLYVFVYGQQVSEEGDLSLYRFSWREKSPTTTTLKEWLPESLGSRLEENRYRHGALLFGSRSRNRNEMEYLGGVYYMEDVKNALANTAIAHEFLSKVEGVTRGVTETAKGLLNVFPGTTSAHNATAQILIIRDDMIGHLNLVGEEFGKSLQDELQLLSGGGSSKGKEGAKEKEKEEL